MGGFRAEVAQRPIPELGRRQRPAALLKLLALAPGHRLHRDEVIDLLWPDLHPAGGKNNLHGTLHALRRELEPGLSQRSASTYVSLQAEVLTLHSPDGMWVDLEAFGLAAAIARDARTPAAYEAALEHYAGDLLPEDRYADWAAGRREAVRALFLDLVLELARLYEQLGEAWAAIRTLQRAVTTDRAHEEGHMRLMRLYAAVGQRHRALRQYDQLRAGMLAELDAEPSLPSQRLYEEIFDSRVPARRLSAEPEKYVPDWAKIALSPREQEVIRLVHRD